MEWTQADIYTTTDGAPYVTAALTAVGVGGFAIEDAADFAEFLEGTVAHWDYVDEDLMRLKDCETRVTFYIPNNPQGMDTLTQVRAEIAALPARLPETDFGRLEIDCAAIRESDWANEWKKYYRPERVGRRLVVCPEWETFTKQPEDIPVLLNPGMAFGTGRHSTTRLCMELLEDCVRGGERVLDVGCGSGILAITAVLLGAKSAKGVDIDALAAKVAAENAARNRVEASTAFYCGTLNRVPELRGRYDILCMNIVADVIISLLETVKAFAAPDAHLLLSGVIDTREQDLRDALRQSGYTVRTRREDGGWVAYDCRLDEKNVPEQADA